MKKHMSMLMTCLLVLLMLAGCHTGQNQESSQSTQPSRTTPAVTTEVPATSSQTQAAEPESETFLEREEGTNQLTLYWTRPGADIHTSDVWIWWDGKEGEGVLFTPCAYGFKCQVNVPQGISEVGFIVRTGCSDPGGRSWGSATKDYDGDRFAILEGEETFIYLVSGDGSQYHSSDGGATLEDIRLFSMAGIINGREIQYFIRPATRLKREQIKVTSGGQEVEIASLSSENNEVITGKIELAQEIDITKDYEVSIEGFGSRPAMPTGIFDSPGFVENYVYEGDDLGAIPGPEGTTFKLWAPTASEVVLNLYQAGEGENDPAWEITPQVGMEKGKKGVWSASVHVGPGVYYTYSVTTAAGTQEAVDPYARAAGVNGNRGMVVDLSATDPQGFEADTFADHIEDYGDAIIWEVHVRDFSNQIQGAKYPGKYLGFTERGLTNSAGLPVGLDYVQDLGVTHVHLQPVYDFATIDEGSSEAQFNWGYDPKNYNVPEGSYATDPFDGNVRIREFKQMVMALHEAGLGVVMDVVYNHTYDGNSNLNKVVPYYYYRYTASGENSNGSGCGNETASERAMFRRFMVDSVTYWAREYHIDGFRFDLMGLHDLETMQAIEEALHAINPRCLIYGEGWTGGTSPLRENRRATQANIKQITASEGAAGSIAVFNDAIRDGLKGSVFDARDTGFINGTVSGESVNKVGFGLGGGRKGAGAAWSVENDMVINYMSCHDNLTLWDKLAISCPDADEETRMAMNRLGAAAVMLAKGTPFFLAGEEMLRSKDGDENSYKSPDSINNIQWEALTPGSDAYETCLFYRQLIEVRKEYAHLWDRNITVTYELLSGNILQAEYRNGDELLARLYLNPDQREKAMPAAEEEGVFILGQAETIAPLSMAFLYYGE